MIEYHLFYSVVVCGLSQWVELSRIVRDFNNIGIKETTIRICRHSAWLRVHQHELWVYEGAPMWTPNYYLGVAPVVELAHFS